MPRWASLCLFLALCEWAASGGSSVSLENPNGQHLAFLRLSVSAAFLGPFALVENEMVFQNPEDRIIEGRFSFALPSSSAGPAMPSRFAMEIGGKLMEGEVVNTSKARRVFREILHEARDPALLEVGQGNIFTARVFPIAPNALVRLVLSYALTVPQQSLRRRLVLPLNGLPKLYDFQFSLVTGSLNGASPQATCTLPYLGELTGTLDANSGLTHFTGTTGPVTPDADAVMEIQETSSSPVAYAVDGGGIVSLFNVATNESGADQLPFSPGRWSIYIDTSASTADIAVARAPLLEALLDAMPEADVEVFAFDIEVVELQALAAKSPALGANVRGAVEERLSLGATDLETLLKHVDNRPQVDSVSGVLIISDAIPTSSERASARLAELVTSRADRVVEFAVLGAKIDIAVAGAVAAAGNGRIVRVPLSPGNEASIAASAWTDLTRPMGQSAVLKQASGWVWPPTAYDLHGGDEVIAFSGGGQGLTLLPPELQLGGTVLKAGSVQAASASFSALLAREVTRARLELLEVDRQLANSATDEAALKFQLVQLSEQSRVMCPHTSLLVLETEEDYTRFDIPRNSLSPILVVEATGVQLRARSEIRLPPLPDKLELPLVVDKPNASDGSNAANASCPDCDPDHPDINDVMPSIMEASGDLMRSTNGARSSHLSALLWLALLLVACAGDWADLHKTADEALAKHGEQGPKERKRDLASDFAGALWTKRKAADLRSFCSKWLSWDPSNGLAYEYLGKAAHELGDDRTALRAVTSIAEIAPRDPEQLLRGAWVAMTLGTPEALSWARALAERSLVERSDNPNTYRALALASWLAGDVEAAANAYAGGLDTDFHNRYGDVPRVLKEEAALMMRATQASSPALSGVSSSAGKDVLLRVTTSWLTDANDVDLHVIDPNGEECFYSHKSTKAGLELYSDQTQGLGPEVVVLKKQAKGTFKIGVKYFSAGAMGASRGTVVIWKLEKGQPVGDVTIVPFTLPAGVGGVQPVAEVTL